MQINIKKLALLARIKLSEEEKKELQKDFGAILSYVDKLQEIEVLSGTTPTTAEGVAPLSSISKNITGLENVVREDEGAHDAGKFSKDLLDNAPATEKGFVKVKKILG
jgi:aspartyl/glutamyl-tRNA(Asn/Gln) amidotransferase C subunit